MDAAIVVPRIWINPVGALVVARMAFQVRLDEVAHPAVLAIFSQEPVGMAGLGLRVDGGTIRLRTKLDQGGEDIG